MFLLYHWGLIAVNNLLEGIFNSLVLIPVSLIDARHTRLVDWQLVLAVTVAYVMPSYVAPVLM